MSKREFENGQFAVYTNQNEEEARLILGNEFSRCAEIRYLMAELLKEKGQPWENFMTNSEIERLNIYLNDETSLLFDEERTAKGLVRHQRTKDGHIKVDENGHYLYELAYRYPDIEGHNADFRLARALGYLMINPSSPGKQTRNKMTNIMNSQARNPKASYSEKIQESAINLLAQLAIRGQNSADDIITGKVDLSEANPYSKCDDLIKLLVVSMRNDFDRELSFEQLIKRKLDSVIKHSDGTEEPANTFFYGILNDSSIIEVEFDKYMGKGAWRQLDSAIMQLYDKDISREEFKAIYEETQRKIIEFANKRMKDKHKQATERGGESKVTSLENKIQMLNTMGETTKLSYAELEELLESKEQNQPTLSLKQKVAQFLRKNNIFMNLTFVENFVNKQLNVFPTNESSAQTAKNRLKKDFENWLSNNGEFKNININEELNDIITSSSRAFDSNQNMYFKPKTEGR